MRREPDGRQAHSRQRRVGGFEVRGKASDLGAQFLFIGAQHVPNLLLARGVGLAERASQ